MHAFQATRHSEIIARAPLRLGSAAAMKPAHAAVLSALACAPALGSVTVSAPVSSQKLTSSPSSISSDGDGAAEHKAVDVEWSDLSFRVKGRTILHAASGAAAGGRVLAIMGPSGSGKTSLLNALAGQVKASRGALLTGKLLVDGVACGGAASVAGLRTAYVKQEDIFYTQMTVRETLLFAARLRLPASIPLSAKKARVDALLTKLNLISAADTIVGDVRRRGISGGERKRLAIGCELLSDPHLLFLDEPTSGLDAFQAQQVVSALKTLADDDGVTVIMSIHQPRGSIYNMFDDLLLLSDGRVVYNGAASAAAGFFAREGFRCPNNINIGEFAVDVVSKSPDGDDDETYLSRLLKLEAAARPARRSAAAAPAASLVEVKDGPARRGLRRSSSGCWTQFRLLFRRAWREVARSKAALLIKVVQQVMIAVIYGGIYTLTDSQSSIQDRFGLLSLTAIGAGNLAIASTIRTFPKEKAILTVRHAARPRSARRGGHPCGGARAERTQPLPSPRPGPPTTPTPPHPLPASPRSRSDRRRCTAWCHTSARNFSPKLRSPPPSRRSAARASTR